MIAKKLELCALLLLSLGLSELHSQTLKDIDGNIYKSITIGVQTWMAENLKTTKYADSTSIPLVNDATIWKNSSTPAYSWYNNAAAVNKNTYGALYNWYSINTGKLCPLGWHVPTDEEWAALVVYLGGGSGIGGKLKELGTTHWSKPNLGATNEISFTALPGGGRSNDGKFLDIGTIGYWWSSTEHYTYLAWVRHLSYNNSNLLRIDSSKKLGLSVRCVKDN
jgi:uncharacterized protein (TIGR02145 family)